MAPPLPLPPRSGFRMIHQGFSSALLALQFGGGAGAMGGMAPFLLQIVAIFGIFYFLIIRPQQTQKKKHEEALRNLKRGDRIVTFGGIIGEVVHVKDGAEGTRGMEDEVTIKSAESRLIVERGRIARIIGGTSAPVAKT
jgi:preprotein translocase subunit YajC